MRGDGRGRNGRLEELQRSWLSKRAVASWVEERPGSRPDDAVGVGEHQFPKKSEQPERDVVAVGLFSGAELTDQAAGSGSGSSFLRERRSLA